MKKRLKFRRISMWGIQGTRTEVGIMAVAMNLAIVGAQVGIAGLEALLTALLLLFHALVGPGIDTTGHIRLPGRDSTRSTCLALASTLRHHARSEKMQRNDFEGRGKGEGCQSTRQSTNSRCFAARWSSIIVPQALGTEDKAPQARCMANPHPALSLRGRARGVSGRSSAPRYRLGVARHSENGRVRVTNSEVFER